MITFITEVYTGEDVGNIPTLQRIRLKPIVTRGLDSIAPILVFSNTIPNDEAPANSDQVHQLAPDGWRSGTVSAGIAIDSLLDELLR